MLRFWSSKFHFWRKSRRKASFLSFKASILKEVSQKCFVFDLQSFIFEGSLAEKLRFGASKLQFWRKSRRNAWFWSFKVSIFEGSLAERLRFCFKASILKEVSQKSFVWQNNLNHTSVDNQLTWTSNHLTAKPLESQINWQPTHLNLRSIDNQLTGIRSQLTNKINRIAHRLTTKSLESQINWEPTLESRIDWQPNHLNLKLIDNQINWISNQLTTTSLEVRINRQPKSFEAHIDWQPNHLNFKSLDNPNHLNLTSIESDINWLSNQLNSARSLPIGSLSLETSATASCGRYVILLYVFNARSMLILLCRRALFPWIKKRSYNSDHRCHMWAQMPNTFDQAFSWKYLSLGSWKSSAKKGSQRRASFADFDAPEISRQTCLRNCFGPSLWMQLLCPRLPLFFLCDPLLVWCVFHRLVI